jgi:multidrug efflux pump subunit AcrB
MCVLADDIIKIVRTQNYYVFVINHRFMVMVVVVVTFVVMVVVMTFVCINKCAAKKYEKPK